ncbi:MAG: pyridoxamine 5'-phosphate oxidase [Pseudohongiellaceae bacterium]
MDLATIRREYLRGGLRREHLSDNPWDLFSRWMEEALEIDIIDPTAMVVATGADGGPLHQRIVLLKHFDEQGLVFFTNYDSRKGQDIDANPRVSALFPWHALERQVMVSGVAEKIPAEQSDAYFSSRPRESRLAALASAQSCPVEGRVRLEAAFRERQEQYPGNDIPRPANWGGYRIRPALFEFWQGGPHRLHDRFVYTCREPAGSSGVTWHLERLAP